MERGTILNKHTKGIIKINGVHVGSKKITTWTTNSTRYTTNRGGIVQTLSRYKQHQQTHAAPTLPSSILSGSTDSRHDKHTDIHTHTNKPRDALEEKERRLATVFCFVCCRSRLPVPQFSRNDFSIWSILKQCIGKVSSV